MTCVTLPPLWNHQREAIERAGKKFALFFDPGCGKTRTAFELYRKSITTWCEIIDSSKPAEPIFAKRGKVLILAPLNVCRNWPNEARAYFPHEHDFTIVAGQDKKQKIRLLQEFRTRSAETGHHFLIANIECMRAKEYRELIAVSGCTFVIVDESHNFKSPTSEQTKGLFQVLEYLKPTHLYLLTGTPAPQGEIDLYTTFAMLGLTKDSFFIWRKKYFIDKNERRRGTRSYFPDYYVNPTKRGEIQAQLAKCSVTAKKNDVLNLPEFLRTKIFAEMSADQRRHYETMREFLFAVDDSGHELNASNLLSRTIRLQQILAGFLGENIETGKVIAIRDNPRLRALDDAIAMTNGEQFIVWTIFKPTYKQIAEALEARNISFGMLTGDVSAEERHRIMEDFQAGKIRALIAHPKAGGVGVNLTAASYAIYYTRNYSLIDDLQAEARNYRGGSERHNRITRIDIITPETIDEDIVEALASKKSVQDFILGLKANRERQAA